MSNDDNCMLFCYNIFYAIYRNMKQLIISDKVQKEMLTDFMIMRETKGLNEQKDRKADKKKR